MSAERAALAVALVLLAGCLGGEGPSGDVQGEGLPTDAPPAWTATGAATGGSLGNGEEPGEGPAATGDPASGVMDRFEAAVLRKLAQASPA